MSMMDAYDEDVLNPADIIVNEQRRARSRTISSLDVNPDEAARAEQLSRASGEDPAIVYPQLEERERNFKAQLTNQLLNNNAFLRGYVESHPLADKVSNDDYGQLDLISSTIEKLPGLRKFSYNLATGIENSIGLSAEGLSYVLGIEGTKGAAKRMKEKTLEDVSRGTISKEEFQASEKTISGMVGSGAGGLIALAPSIIAGGLPGAAIQMGLTGGAEARLRAAQAGMDEQTQATAFTTGFAINSILGVAPLHLLQRPAQATGPGVINWSLAKLKDAGISGGIFAGFGELQHGFNEWAAKLLYDPNAAYHPDFNRVVSSFILGGFLGATFNRVAPYVEAGKEIPPGAHPVVDEVKGKQAEIDIDNLDAALKEASKSATRERSPELFKLFIQQHTDAKIGVSADAIVKMYGEKLPEIEDNKLGWVPDIQKQLEVARETGGDIEIPLSDWLARVDPAVAKELHDDIRVRPNGLTLREGTALQGMAQRPQIGEKTPFELDREEFAQKNNLPPITTSEMTKLIEGRIRQIEYDRRLTGKPEGEPYPANPELTSLRKRLRELRRQTALEGRPMVEAMHASPHVFDAFSLDKIGSGQGAAAFGHGLYFSTAEGTHQDYLRSFSDRLIINKQQIDSRGIGTFDNAATPEAVAALALRKAGSAQFPQATLTELRKRAAEIVRAYVRDEVAYRTAEGPDRVITEGLELLEKGDIKQGAQSYRVRIHAEKEHFLDWDRPLSEQSPHVQERLRPLVEERLAVQRAAREKALQTGRLGTRLISADERLDFQEPLPDALAHTGEQAYKKVGLPAKDRYEGARQASDKLREVGIPGIRYLDQGSRNQQRRLELEKELADFKKMEAEERARGDEALAKSRAEMAADVEAELAKIPEPTYNYVIFDDKLIEIIDRNGEAINAVRQQAGLEPLARRVWTDEQLESAADALEGKIEEHAPGLKAVVPEGELSSHEMKAVEAANEVLDRILPEGGVIKAPARLITQEGRGGVQGFFQQYTDRIPTILYLMDPKKAVHTVRHEAIHFLRHEGFFTKEEWDTLRHAALKEGWIEHYDIARRYEGEKIGNMLEEAVAERYADWAEGNKHGSEEVNKVLGKIKDFAIKIIEAIKKALPHNASVEEIFQKIESGEIARREGTEPIDKRAYRSAQEMAPEAEAAQRDLFAKANAIGMTVPQYERYMRLIKKRGEEDARKQMERAEAFERKQQTKEWKADEARIREEVTNDIQFRPDIAAATFFTEGRLYDTVKNQRPKLDASLIEPELAARLPKELLLKKGGINPDDIAPLFGYQTGKEMVSKLAEMNEAKGAMDFKEFVKGIVDDEVAQRMLREHGMLEENILKAAQEHVVGDTQMDILHEEFIGLGMKSKVLTTPFTKDQIKAWVTEKFDGLPMGSIKIDKFLSEAGKAGRDAEMKLLINKVEEAFQQKQRQYIATLLAAEAKRLEKEQEKFEKTAKRFSARKVEGVQQSYTDYVQSLLSLAGMRVRRSDLEIAESIEAFGTGSLENFIKTKNDAGWEIQASDAVQQNKVKPYDQMTVGEFREFKEAIDSLVHTGRQEKKIIVGREREDFEAHKGAIIERVTQLPVRDLGSKWRYMFDATLVKMEEIVRDLDGRMDAGPLFKSMIVPLVHAKRREYDMLKALSNELNIIKGFGKEWRKSLSETVPNDFLIDPRTNTPFDLSRENMINIMLNFGNRSNIQKFTEGYAGKKNAGILEARLWQLFDQHARAEDWQFVQKIWDLFEGWRGESDEMYRRISGVPPKWIQVEPIQTRHGEFKGGYFPILFDRDRSRIEVLEDRKANSGGTFGENYIRAMVGSSYTKARTGYVDYVSFEGSIEQVAGRMQQMIHDITHREAVMSVGKIVYDPEIRAAMRKHYGPEYTAQMHPWLRDVANKYNSSEQSIAAWNSIMRRARENLIVHALGYNLRVIGSPNLGMFNPSQAVKFYSDYFFNRDLVMSKSDEIPHTLQNMDRDFREKLESLVEKNKWDEFKRSAFEASMWPALKLEQQARMIGWWTRYNRELNKGLSEADAIAEADNQVRSFHGAAGTMDLPAVMRHPNEMMKTATVFYGFFNTMYNWQRRIPGDVKTGEYKTAAKDVYGAILIPAAFGALLFNQAKESDSWFKTIGKALLLQPLSTVPIVREASSYFLEGFPPRTPIESMMTAVGSAYSDVKKWREGRRIQKPITHGANVIGLSTGLPLGQVGRTSQFGYDVYKGEQRPKNIQEWMRGVISGEAKLKP